MHQPQQQHEQQLHAVTATANISNILTHNQHYVKHVNQMESNYYGQPYSGDNIQNIPMDFQPLNGYNINNNNHLNQYGYEYITKDNMLYGVQTTPSITTTAVATMTMAPLNGMNGVHGLLNGNRLYNNSNGSGDETPPTYILLQNVNNYGSNNANVPMRIGTDLLILNPNDGTQIKNGEHLLHHINGGGGAVCANNSPVHSPVDLKCNDENSGSGGSYDSPMNEHQVDEKAPDHHARRPMNAFLIFCKRHRAIVREKYPNLENRSITKILGDWWANLDKEDKISYTSLAKQYKDAFFNANPNFKWYKLPAPPLRSTVLPSRSGANSFDYDHNGFNHANGISHLAPEETAIKCEPIESRSEKRPTNVGIFKFADEAEMGGLNSLMPLPESMLAKHNNNIGETLDDKKDSDALHKILGETRSFLQRTMSDGSSNGEHMALNSPDKSYEFDFEDDANAKKSSRACKGKRYMEFMNARKVAPIMKKAKLRTTSSSSSASSPGDGQQLNGNCKQNPNNGVNKIEYENVDHPYANQEPHRINDEQINGSMPSAVAADPSKLYDANDFDLEEKIRALPARSLDKYLSRKRETKKRKKVGTKRHNSTNANNGTSNQRTAQSQKIQQPLPKRSETAQEAKERLMMVGSQKRKARKESITRREVANTMAIVDSVMVKNNKDKHIQLTTNGTLINSTTNGTSDLLFLATIAEQAANIGVQ